MRIVFDGISTVTPNKLIGFEASLVPENIADELISRLIESDPSRFKIKLPQVEGSAWYFKTGGKK